MLLDILLVPELHPDHIPGPFQVCLMADPAMVRLPEEQHVDEPMGLLPAFLMSVKIAPGTDGLVMVGRTYPGSKWPEQDDIANLAHHGTESDKLDLIGRDSVFYEGHRKGPNFE